MSIATLIHATAPMPPAPIPESLSTHPAAILIRRIDAILLPFLNLIGFLQHLLGPLALPVRTRIVRTRQRLVRALLHVAAGRTPRRRTPKPQSASAPANPRPRAPTLNLRRRHGWLPVLLDHNARGLASQFTHLLAEPGVATLLAASPGATRTLRPLCRMLGVTLPAPLALPAPPPRPRRPAPATRSARGAVQETPRRSGKYPRFNPLIYSPGRIPPWPKLEKPG